MNYHENKNYYLFWLLHAGISKTTINTIHKKLKLSDLKAIYSGRFRDYFIQGIRFSPKDIKILSDNTSIQESKEEVDILIKKFEENKIMVLFYYDSNYPESLRKISNPPFVLFVKGNIELLNKIPIVSIAGTRKISNYSAKKLEKVVSQLVNRGYGIVSGLALGTDTIANKIAYESGGYSIAIIPSSIFSIEPKSNTQIANNILSNNGTIISEHYSEITSKSRFINRNRIISGMGTSLLIPEFNEKSGTMHTARFAWKQHKLIFCFNNNSNGVRKLLDSHNAIEFTNINNFISIMEEL